MRFRFSDLPDYHFDRWEDAVSGAEEVVGAAFSFYKVWHQPVFRNYFIIAWNAQLDRWTRKYLVREE